MAAPGLSTQGASLGLEYEPLQPDRIRLLEVVRETSDSVTLQCSLKTSTLAAATQKRYVALSYTWQAADGWSFTRSDLPRSSVSIGSNNESLNLQLHYMIHAAYEYYEALNDSTKAAKSRYTISLWIDALCIDQSSVDDKNQQVAKMRDIYSSAASVFVSLGIPPFRTRPTSYLSPSAAMSTSSIGPRGKRRSSAKSNPRPQPTPWPRDNVFSPTWYADRPSTVTSIGTRPPRPSSPVHSQTAQARDPGNDGNSRHSRHAVSPSEFTPAIRIAILQHPYWRRSWIIQELVCGINVVVQVGNNVTSFQALVHHLKDNNPPSNDRDMILNRDNILIIDKLRSAQRPKLQQLLAMTRYSVSSDPRDAVYAKLGIASNAVDVFGTPDYTVDVDSMLMKLAHGIVQESSDLRMLCSVESCESYTPSWVPNWYACKATLSPTATDVSSQFHRTKWHRTLSITEAGGPNLRQAAPAVPRFRMSSDGLRLHAQGVRLGNCDPSHQLASTEQERGTTSADSRTIVQILEPLYRTMLVHHPYYADSMPDLARILAHRAATIDLRKTSLANMTGHLDLQWATYDYWYRQHRAILLHGRQLHHWVRQLYMLDPLKCVSAERYEELKGWAQARLVLYLTNRRVAILNDDDLALVPRESQSDDFICVLFDCPHPVVLRPEGNHFTLVGHCYVDSLREDESWDDILAKSPDSSTFDIH